MKIEVTVTPEHFKRGQRKPGKCPVALALREAGVKGATVDCFGRRWSIKRPRIGADRLPQVAARLSMRFDRGEAITKPVTFTFDTEANWILRKRSLTPAEKAT